MSELYAITITGIVASEHGDPMNWFSGDTSQLMDMKVHTRIFATHEDGRIEFIGNAGSGMWANERIYQSAHPIDDPDKLIGDALDDANGFYEMFDGWEGVEERVERLHQAFDVMNKNEAKKYSPEAQEVHDRYIAPLLKPEISPAAQKELDGAISKVRPDLYPTCPECRDEFKRTHALQKYCSATCRKRRNVRVAHETARQAILKEEKLTVEVLNRIV